MPKLYQVHILDPGKRHTKWSGVRLAYSVEPFTVAGPQGSRIPRYRVQLKVGKEAMNFIFYDVKILQEIDYDG
jgi:hypothetical protein